MLPNGMISHLFRPEEGCHNDNFLLTKSGLLDTCAVHAIHEGTGEDTPTEERFLQLFGDPTYGVSHQIISPYAGFGEQTDEEMEWNAGMAAVMIEIEHGFGIVQNTWPFLNAGWKMHVYSSPVGRYY